MLTVRPNSFDHIYNQSDVMQSVDLPEVRIVVKMDEIVLSNKAIETGLLQLSNMAGLSVHVALGCLPAA